jgi:tetratricopeptide (TPR) repeat protein
MKTLAKKPWITRITEYPNKKLCWFLFIAATILYLPTITFDYTLDDGFMIVDNKYTQQGIKGVKDIFTHDVFASFLGEDSKIVEGGRYRPFTHFIFAIQKELFGFKPWIGHLTNILSYALLVTILFLVILKLLSIPPFNKENVKLIAFLATVLYLFHPIHTEVVCNIKSLDEIFSMLGSLGAILLLLSYHNKPKIYKLFLSGFIFFIALLSKENAITWIGVWAFWLIFTHKSFSKKYIINSFVVLLIPAALFLFIRSQVIGEIFNKEIQENLLNNPFIYSTKAEEIATVFFTWLLYFKLLIFPHPLTHDYYPKQIPILNFSDFRVWLALLLVIGIFYLLIWSWKRKPIIAFSILIFICNFSIVSNLLFNVGTFMNERFVFSASIGFTLAVGWLFAKWGERSTKWAMYVLITILALYGVKTVTRSFVWKDNLTLFTTDAKISKNSAKVNTAAGETLIKIAEKTNDISEKQKLLGEALIYLDRAKTIYPEYFSAYELSSIAYFNLKNYKKSLENLLLCTKINPDNLITYNNISIIGINAYNDSVFDVARDAFRYLINKFPDSTRYLYNLAVVYRDMNELDSALFILNQSLKIDNCAFKANLLLGEIYNKLKDFRTSEYYFKQAIKCDSTDAIALENLGVIYFNVYHQPKQAIYYFKEAYKYNQNNLNILNNLSIIFQYIGLRDSSEYYLQKANQIKK